MGFWEAWRHWLAGESVSQEILWGWKILYWGRAGKCLAFLSTVAIIAELVGHRRISRYATKIKEWNPPGLVPRLFRAPQRWTRKMGAFLAVGFACQLLIVSLGKVTGHQWDLSAGFQSTCCCGTFVAMVAFIIEMARFYAELFAQFLMIVSHLLEKPRIKKTILGLSLAVTMAGFLFDLLGS